jgi:hypothetical protein
MAKQETEFIPGFPLRYNWKSTKLFFDLIGVKTIDGFGRFLSNEGFSNETIENIIFAGLKKENPNMTKEEAIEKIEQYSEGKGYLEVINLAIQCLIDAGILDSNAIAQAQKQVADMGEPNPRISQ